MSLSAALDNAGLADRVGRISARAYLANPEPPTDFGTLGEVIDRASVWPWVVRVYCEFTNGRRELFGGVVYQRDEPIVGGYVPAGATVLWTDVYRATRFNEMDERERERRTSDYRSYLMARKARALGVESAALRPWVDYDCIAVDGAVARWVKTGVSR